MVLLVLVVGIPASGKTTFLRLLNEELKQSLEKNKNNIQQEAHPVPFSDNGTSSSACVNEWAEASSSCVSVRSLDVFHLDECLAAIAEDTEVGEGTSDSNSIIFEEVIGATVDMQGGVGVEPESVSPPHGGGLIEPGRPPAFTPARWKRASIRLYHEVEQRLRGLVGDHSCTEDLGVCGGTNQAVTQRSIHLLVVEDNMHYRSMRERYWKLCRALLAPSDVAPLSCSSRILLLELRFNASLEACLRRNESRRVPQGNTAGWDSSAYVQPDVIRSLHHNFEHCLREELSSSAAMHQEGSRPQWDSPCVEEIFRRLDTTCEWDVLQCSPPLVEEEEVREAMTLVVRHFLYGVLPHPQTWRAFAEQSSRLWKWIRHGQMAMNQQQQVEESRSATLSSRVHQFDRALRRVIGEFYKDIRKGNVVEGGVLAKHPSSIPPAAMVHKQKQRSLEEFRSRLASREGISSADEEVLLRSFRECLVHTQTHAK